MPVLAIAEVDKPFPETAYGEGPMSTTVRLYLCDGAATQARDVVISPPSSERPLMRFPVLEFRGEMHKVISYKQSLLWPYTFSPDGNSRLPKAQQRLPLHELVYGQIHEELPAALNELRRRLGVPQQTGGGW